jgi:hypothetical protein
MMEQEKLFIGNAGVNFTNILRARFSYESFARSFFVLDVEVKLFICARILAQLRQYNVGEIDSCRQNLYFMLLEKNPSIFPSFFLTFFSSFF